VGKRVFWFAVGAGAGAVSAVWGITTARRANERLAPDQLPRAAGRRLRLIGSDVRDSVTDAVSEGRAAARVREDELRRGRRTGDGRSGVLR
jgi:uncharacterized membrane protein